MSTADGAVDKPGRRVTLEQLAALNEELAWLTRAGLPLTLGLRTDQPGRPRTLAELTERLAARVGQGMSLLDAVRAEGDVLPPIYRATVEAGLRSGRLATALERLAELARSADQLRRRVNTALIYPVAVFAVAYVLFVGLCFYFVPELVATDAAFGREPAGWLRALVVLNDWLPLWGPLVPLAVAGAWFWWNRAAQSALEGNGQWTAFGAVWLPGVSDQLQANFAELVALLVEQETPLPEALELAGAAAGSEPLAQGTQAAALSLRAGQPVEQAVAATPSLPPLVRELLVSAGTDQAALVGGLREAARIFRQRALRKATRFKLLVPLLAVVFVGGTAVLVYVLSVFVPLVELLRGFVAAGRV